MPSDELPADRSAEAIETLRVRFEKNMYRHRGLVWPSFQARIEEHPENLWSLNEMERTGGEPDVIGYDEEADEYIFCDCSPQSPKGRHSICYDREALESRKKHKPEKSAIDVAEAMGIEILSVDEYLALQKLGPFDTKTSSWVRTSANVRELGGALFGDYRFGRAFIYHNGAESYYAARSFRGSVRV